MRNALDLFKWAEPRFFQDFFPHFDGEDSTQGATRLVTPRFWSEELAEKFKLSIDVPGVKKEAIRIEVDGDILKVSGERTLGEKATERFERKFTLPAHVNSDQIKAEHIDGVLILSLPKAEVRRPKQIEIAA